MSTFSYLNSCFRAFRQVFPKIIVIRTTKHANKKWGGLWPTCPPLLLPCHLQRGKRNREGMEWKGVIEKIRGSILLFCREKRGDKKKAQLSELLVR